jgi:hypothetical protein
MPAWHRVVFPYRQAWSYPLALDRALGRKLKVPADAMDDLISATRGWGDPQRCLKHQAATGRAGLLGYH